MYFNKSQSNKFSEYDIQQRHLIPVFLEHLRIGFIQPRDVLRTNDHDYYLARDVQEVLLTEAEYFYTNEIMPQEFECPDIRYKKKEDHHLFDLEFIKTRNETSEAIDAIEVVFLRTEKRESIDDIISRIETRI